MGQETLCIRRGKCRRQGLKVEGPLRFRRSSCESSLGNSVSLEDPKIGQFVFTTEVDSHQQSRVPQRGRDHCQQGRQAHAPLYARASRGKNGRGREAVAFPSFSSSPPNPSRRGRHLSLELISTTRP